MGYLDGKIYKKYDLTLLQHTMVLCYPGLVLLYVDSVQEEYKLY